MTEELSSDERARERVGTVLAGKWTLERLLGEGGMGAVYQGRHRNGARGAVKLLHPELARHAEIRERFLREGYAANRVGHPGAVQVLDDDVIKEGPDAGACYLVMELLDGESLEDRLKSPMSEREVLEILDQLLEVLEAAHANGVVHRDLKPANIFLAKDRGGEQRVKILDFGLARIDEVQSVTRAGLALGTPSFMSPEQASGRTQEIDGRTDLFALGATAFMIVAGRGVHEAEGLLELVGKMGNVPAPKLREVAPRASEAIAKVIDGAVAFRREDRYATATAMRADVQAALAALAGADVAPTGPAAVTPPLPIELAATRAEGKALRAAPEAPEATAKPRRRARGGLFLFGLLALAGGTALAGRHASAVAFAEDLLGRAAQFGWDADVPNDDDAGTPPPLVTPPLATPLPTPTIDAGAPDAADAGVDGGDLDAGALAEDDEDEDEDDAGADDGGIENGGIEDAGSSPLAVRPPAPRPPVRPTKKPAGTKRTTKPKTPTKPPPKKKR